LSIERVSFCFPSFDGVGFGIFALIANKIHHKYYGWGIASIPLFGDHEVGRLIDQYGPGFIRLDVTILEAMDKGNKNSKKISIYCDETEKVIKKRMKFLKEKGVIKFE